MIRRGAVLLLAALLAVPAFSQGALAAEEDLQKKLDELSKEVKTLQQQVAQTREGEKEKKKSISDWLTIGGDYRFRVDSLKGDVPSYLGFQNYLAWMMGGMVGSPTVTPGTQVRN